MSCIARFGAMAPWEHALLSDLLAFPCAEFRGRARRVLPLFSASNRPTSD